MPKRTTAVLPLFVLAVPLLGGCAAPLPFQVASWVADGLSYVVTEKSLTDHGLSAVTGEDCAIWRAATDKAVCREDERAVVMEPDLTVR